MHVAGDGVRREALLERWGGDGEIEATAAMADVEEDTAPAGLEGLRQHFAAGDDGIGLARIGVGVGDDVARAERFEDFAERNRRIADVAHDACPRAGDLRGADGAAKRLHPVGPDDVFRHAHFHAQAHVAVLRHGLGAGVQHVVDVHHLADLDGIAGETDGGDVDEPEQPRARLADDVMAEAGKAGIAGVAGVDAGRGGGEAHHLVGRKADAGDLVVIVAVQIDQPGRDDGAPGVEDLDGARRRDALGDRRDLPVLDGYVAVRVQLLRRIDDGAARHEQVELQVGIAAVEEEG